MKVATAGITLALFTTSLCSALPPNAKKDRVHDLVSDLDNIIITFKIKVLPLQRNLSFHYVIRILSNGIDRPKQTVQIWNRWLLKEAVCSRSTLFDQNLHCVLFHLHP